MSVIDDYLSSVSGRHRELLDQLRAIIVEAAPEASEAISWGMPTYKLNGNLVHFAPGKSHVGLYPGADGVSFAAARLDELGLRYSKGVIQFPLDRELPGELIASIVAFRVEQQRERG